ncbi:MAG TPA: HEAT repeat domain-containing protein [Verrucomicrobiae bacterium]
MTTRKKEPFYQDKTAGEWLEFASTNFQRMPEAGEAFRAMGKQGAEFLGDELLRKPSATHEWLIAHHQKIPSRLRTLVLKPQPQSKSDTIIALLNRLGTNAAPAIPHLITWLEKHEGAAISSTSIPLNQFPMVSNQLYRTPRSFRSQYTSIIVSQGVQGIHAINLPMPSGGVLTFQTQVSVSVPGTVATNVIITTRYRSNAIPYTAYNILTNIGSEDPRVIPILLRPLDRNQQAFPTFGTNLKTAARMSAAMLLNEAENGTDKIRAYALLKLTLPESISARELFTRRLELNDPFSREIIIESFLEVTNDLDRLVPLTLNLLKKDRTITQPTSSLARKSPAVFAVLKNFSHHRPEVISGLQELLPQATTTDKASILQLLGEIGNSNNVSPELLRAFTNHYEANVRMKAWFALGQITRDVQAKVNEQITLMEYGRDDIVWEACGKLGDLEADAVNAVPILQKHLQHQNERIISKAAEALGKIGPQAKVTLPLLEMLLNHPRPQIKETAKEAIRKISGEPKAKGAE